MDPARTSSCLSFAQLACTDDLLDLSLLLSLPNPTDHQACSLPLPLLNTSAQPTAMPFFPASTPPTPSPATSSLLFGELLHSPNMPLGSLPSSSTLTLPFYRCSTTEDTSSEFGNDQRYLHTPLGGEHLGIDSSTETILLSNNPSNIMSAFQSNVSSPAPRGTQADMTLALDAHADTGRMLRRNTQPVSLVQRRGSLSLARSHPYIPAPAPHLHGATHRRGSSNVAYPVFPTQPSKTVKARTIVIPAINQDGTYKRCSNCATAETPSWRRHPDTQDLLCNACGLYLRLHRKPRPIAIDDAGHVQVIRKNAAVQRDPINLPHSRNNELGSGFSAGGTSSVSSMSTIGGECNMDLAPVASGGFDYAFHEPSPTPLLFNAFAMQACPLALRASTSLASIQSIGEPFSALEMYAPILALEYAAPQLAEHSGDHSQATPDYETQQDL